MCVFVLGVDHLVCLLFLLMAAYLSPPSVLPFVDNKEICFMYSFIINSLFIYLLFFYLEYTGVYQSVNIPLEFPYSPGDVSGELIG